MKNLLLLFACICALCSLQPPSLSAVSVDTIVLDSVNERLDSIVRSLDPVTVRAKPRIVRLDRGRLSFDLPELLKGSGITNIFDALERMPGLIKVNDRIEMAGASSFSILLNGQNPGIPYDQLVLLLKSMPVERLRRVELMYDAPPETGVRGAAVNILLTEIDAADASIMQGMITTKGYYQRKVGLDAGANLLVAAKGWQAEANVSYAFLNPKFLGYNEELRHKLNDGKTYRIVHQTDSYAEQPHLAVYAALSYLFRPNRKLQARYYLIGQRRRSDNTSLMAINDQPYDATFNRVKEPSDTHYFLLEWRASDLFDASYHYTSSDQQTDQMMTTPQAVMPSYARIRIDTWTARLNRTCDKIWGIDLSYGLSTRYARTRSSAYAGDLSLNFVMNELGFAGFFGGSKQILPQLNLSAYLSVDYHLSRDGTGRRLSERTDFYPQISANYVISPSHILQFNVSSQRKYPSFAQLSPVEKTLNSYSSITGNPFLQPERTYNTSLSYILHQRYVFTAFTNLTYAAILQMPYQRADALRSVTEIVNFDYSHYYGLSAATASFTVRQIPNLRITPHLATFVKSDRFTDFHGLNLTRSKLVAQGSVSIDYKLPVEAPIFLNLTGSGHTTAIQGLFLIRPTGALAASATYQLLNGRAKIVLSGQDLLSSSVSNLQVDLAGQWSKMRSKNFGPSFSLSFSYNFGGYKASSNDIDTKRYDPNR